MTPEMILIIILVAALAACALGWANAEAHKQALDAVYSTLARERDELSLELDRVKAAKRCAPVGPRFEFDPEDGCWVLKDCIRIDHDVVWWDQPKFKAYINSTLKWKNNDESKPETGKAAKSVDC